MHRTFFCFLSVLVIISSSFSQSSYPSYYSQSSFSLASPGALKYGLYGYDNPALLPHLTAFDAQFLWDDAIGKWNDFNHWGLFTAIPHVGFGLIHQRDNGNEITDYRFSLGFGDRSLSTGFGYGWSTGDREYFGRTNVATLGLLSRPNCYVSIGATGTIATAGEGKEAVLDLALRPRGNEFLTFFADAALRNNQQIKNISWSAGLALEALPGVRITGRYFDIKAFNLGFELSFGTAAVMTQAHYDSDQKYMHNTYGIRLGALDRSVFGTMIAPEQRYADVNLNGQLKYQRYRFFDGSNTLSGLLQQIKAAKEDPNITGIAINASGMSINREMLWEMREQLKEFKANGKHVVMFIDYASIDDFHFFSIADKIVMDPLGMLMLQGYVMGRTYYKGTLEKLGIGFDEWRFFKYKSANESFSRDKMSDGDREQRQKLIDDFYTLAKSDICEARKISPEHFDQIVNDTVLFRSEDAFRAGLIDTIGRWEAIGDVIKSLEGETVERINPGALPKFHLPTDNRWSEPPCIAIIYALGACAMDEGIKARSLSKIAEAAANADKVKAIILRVDSPGGDAMASDYVAEALKNCKGKKPVIISQGSVAASGGYWLSMYGDTIVAAPNTITGSIGVIGGWFYNKGLKDTLGMTTDLVKVGKHADLGFGFSLPFIGGGIPDRNLNEEERAKMEQSIKWAYNEFVAKVASGRDKKPDEIEPIAQGRVWSGVDGKKNGLVDVLGGLETAIQIAKERAGIAPDDEVTIIELPELGWFDFSMFMPKLLPFSVEDDPVIQHLRFRLKHNGEPMPILPIDEMGTEINH